MHTPMFSIVVPVYKVEKYLLKCLESIESQTYSNYEVILVDDGSPDQCPAICDRFAQTDSRYKVIHQLNKGLSGARNTGLQMAKGRYIYIFWIAMTQLQMIFWKEWKKYFMITMWILLVLVLLL